MPESDQERSTGALSMLRNCLNPKVLVGLAVVGVLVWTVQPELIRPVLPVLFALACPLSMVVMMRAMHGGASQEQHREANPSTTAPEDRRTHLQERLARARAETEVVQSELARLEAAETTRDDDRERRSRAPTDETHLSP